MRPITCVSLVSLALGLMLSPMAGRGAAVDRLSVEAGTGDNVDIVGISIGSADWKRWSFDNDWSLSLYGKGKVALWQGREHDAENRHVVDFGAYPVLHLERSTAGQVSPYFEASVGVNLLSKTQINDNRKFSTAFQFGEFLGGGVAFGEKRQYELGLRVQHVSNGNIKFPNDGLTYGSLVFQYRLGAP